MPAPHALIAGATGIVGRRIAENLTASGWQVTGLCRRPPGQARAYRLIAVDLIDAAQCRATLAGMTGITHVFHAARYDHPEGTPELVDTNTTMLRNLVDAVEPVARDLRHVHLVHGTKYYGHMLGPMVVPVTENHPRARVPLFYPGTEASFHARTQFTYVPLLARAIRWMVEAPCCANQSYNVVNGDSPRWSELWPRFADYFGLAAGGAKPLRLADYMAGKDGVWERLTRSSQLEPVALASRVLWPYADYLFAPEWDIISSMSKARRDGFDESVDSVRMFLDMFELFRRGKIIP